MLSVFRESDRLLLREFVKQDLQCVLAYRRLPMVKRFDTFGPNTKQDVEAIIEKALSWQREVPRTRYYGAICIKTTDTLIGEYNLALDRISNSAEIGFMLRPSHWGKGFASETLMVLRNYARECGLSHLTGSCDPKNSAAIRVMRNAGMVLVSKGDGLRFSLELHK